MWRQQDSFRVDATGGQVLKDLADEVTSQGAGPEWVLFLIRNEGSADAYLYNDGESTVTTAARIPPDNEPREFLYALGQTAFPLPFLRAENGADCYVTPCLSGGSL